MMLHSQANDSGILKLTPSLDQLQPSPQQEPLRNDQQTSKSIKIETIINHPNVRL